MSGHAPVRRSEQAIVNNATSALTCERAQCIRPPFSRASTTNLLALSALPLPMGKP